MIDWTKPIETVDGREARLVEAVIEKLQHIVYVYGESDDVFLVDPEGYRCDDRITYIGKRQEPFIRNVRVKRKAWISLAIHDYYKGDTKEEIEARITNPNFKAVYCEWEEEP